MTAEGTLVGDLTGTSGGPAPAGAMGSVAAAAAKPEPEPQLGTFLDLVRRALAEESVKTGNRFALDLPGVVGVELDRWEVAAFVGSEAGTRRSTIIAEAVATWLWCLAERHRLDGAAPAGNWYTRVQALLADAEARSRVLQHVIAADEGEGEVQAARKLGLTRQKLDGAALDLGTTFRAHGGTASVKGVSRRSMAQRVKRVAVEVSKRAAVTLAILTPLLGLLALRAYVLVTPEPQFDLEELSIALPLVDARQKEGVFEGTVTEMWGDFSHPQRRDKTVALLRKLEPGGAVRVVLRDPFGKVVADAEGSRVTLP